jgi:hypothetical protein
VSSRGALMGSANIPWPFAAVLVVVSLLLSLFAPAPAATPALAQTCPNAADPLCAPVALSQQPGQQAPQQSPLPGQPANDLPRIVHILERPQDFVPSGIPGFIPGGSTVVGGTPCASAPGAVCTWEPTPPGPELVLGGCCHHRQPAGRAVWLSPIRLPGSGPRPATSSPRRRWHRDPQHELAHHGACWCSGRRSDRAGVHPHDEGHRRAQLPGGRRGDADSLCWHDDGPRAGRA